MIEAGLTKSRYDFFPSISLAGIEMPSYWSPCIGDESNVGAFGHQTIAPLLLLRLTTDRATSPNKDNGYHNYMMLKVTPTIMLMFFGSQLSRCVPNVFEEKHI